MTDELIPAELDQLGERIAERMGLHFPPGRTGDLRRGIHAAASEFGFTHPAACLRWLLAKPLSAAQLDILAGNLTVGETYFFREPQTFEILREHILPRLVERHRVDRRLRLWSAACCTGEEPYSLAIALQRALPNPADWRVTLRGTDINPRFLAKATTGVYGEWSFRNAPSWLKPHYFEPQEDGRRWGIRPEIKRMVEFSQLNLAEDAYPSLAGDTNAMDVIFCRNVLIYFSPAQADRVIARLHRCLAEGGWLVLSPSETPHLRLPELEPVNFEGATFFRKEPPASTPVTRPRSPVEEIAVDWFRPEPPPAPVVQVEAPRPPELPPSEPTSKPLPVAPDSAPDSARAMYEQGRYADVAFRLTNQLSAGAGLPGERALLIQALANLGRLAEALTWADQAVAEEKLNPVQHYLRACILREQGAADEATLALKRTLYLDPHHALAHFALGTLARELGRTQEAGRSLANAQAAARRLPPDTALLGADGLTAGRLVEIVTTLMASAGESNSVVSEARP
jgi:chemotaxis protein methyltransferase CheR